ncbi:MAG: hypothetical protein H6591_09455 [Flavobacteriales bacterium]|nr:hypothetical protein [Flavobacteriales bacterium]
MNRGAIQLILAVLLSTGCDADLPKEAYSTAEESTTIRTHSGNAYSLCRAWKGEMLTTHGKPDPSRDVKGKVMLELRCDSSFHLSDATEGTTETVAGRWAFTPDSLLILHIPDEGELTRFKVLDWDSTRLSTFVLEAPEEEVIVVYSAAN